jgi:co-chaperonin GroES (HSP10)
VGNDVPIVKRGNSVYYDAVAGHDISYNDSMYRVIRARDIVIVE